MQRVTNVIKEFVPEYKYTDELAVRATFATTIGEQGFTVNSIKNFIQQLRKQNLGGFSEFTYTELESDLNAILAEPAIVVDEGVAKTALEALREDLKSAEGEFKNEELAAQIRSQIADLEKKVTTAAPTEDIQAKRADIERRRRDGVLGVIPIDDEFVIYPEQFDQFNREGNEVPKGSLSGKDIEYNIQQAINDEIE
jgi:DNA-binding transcriptional MerR regulator